MMGSPDFDDSFQTGGPSPVPGLHCPKVTYYKAPGSLSVLIGAVVIKTAATRVSSLCAEEQGRQQETVSEMWDPSRVPR